MRPAARQTARHRAARGSCPSPADHPCECAGSLSCACSPMRVMRLARLVHRIDADDDERKGEIAIAKRIEARRKAMNSTKERCSCTTSST
jgi:hypothetical protein